MRNPFKKPKAKAQEAYDPAQYTPDVRVSVCTGEKVAGFRGRDGRVHEIMLIRSEKDLEEFRETYGIRGEVEKIF